MCKQPIPPPAIRHTEPLAMAHSSPLADAPRSSPPASHVASHMYIMDMALPLEFSAPVLPPSSLLSPFPPTSPLVPSSLPSSPLVPSSRPEPAPPERPPEPTPPELFRAYGPLNFPQKILGAGGHIPVAIVVRPEAKATEAIQLWPPKLPDPPWPPGLFAPPWLPELPDPPWRLPSSLLCVCPAPASRVPRESWMSRVLCVFVPFSLFSCFLFLFFVCYYGF
ncbi:hypothetical protein M9458_045042 [Cirrhinus mrigala]|uniref:Uncharacterized protein n=1 Tax=Cirrhinus mrigala TaxID=683832 RepID=A0ABD0NI44_CIRMR